MARRASVGEWLEDAKACLAKAKTVEELRLAQAVVLPLEFGLSLEQTAQAIGVSGGWVCQLRTRFVRGEGVPSYGARLGRTAREIFPQSNLRQHRCLGKSPRAGPSRH